MTQPRHAPAAARPTGWQRLHGALMPDYNPKATAFWWSAVMLGTLALAWAVNGLQALPEPALAQVLIGVAMAVIAGFFPVRIPRSTNSFAVGEIFVFLLLLLHGPGPAALAAAGEAFVGSYTTSRRWTSRIASPAMAALAMVVAGSGLHALLGFAGGHLVVGAGTLLVTAMAFALMYFVLNTLLVTTVLLLKRKERLNPREMLGSFGFVGIAYCGCASVAALLFLTFEQSGLGVLMAAVPIIAMLVATLHFFFRQQVADESVRRDRMEAAEREAEQAARHVRELAESERRFQSAFTHASIGMLLVSFEGRILQTNNALRGLLGHEDSFGPGTRFGTLVQAEDQAALGGLLERMRSGGSDTASIELRCLRRDGGEVWVSLHSSFFAEARSGESCLILQVQDISARRHAEARLHHIAFHDGLTGLPNRARLHEHLRQAIELAQADAHRQFAVMFLDFDRFKLINDSLGHAVGDEFLIQVARRLQNSVRPGDVVARLGGDEFVVLATKVTDEAAVTTLAERLQTTIGKPFSIVGTEISTSVSIGITFSRFGYSTPDEVLRDADIAMYRAKAQGKARHALFDIELHAEVSQRLRLEGELRQALAEGALEVHYQPVFELESGALAGFEALARWPHPQQGMVPPALFVPIAEECGLIVQLTDFVLEHSAQRLREWSDLDPSLARLSVQVNLSGNDLSHPALVQRVLQTLVKHRLQPQQLTLELTENILAQRLHAARDKLDALRHLGVGLSVDDFGTGYSSLSHLASLPVDSLKIDRSFIARIGDNSRGAEVLRAIVMLGRSLGKSVVAEGIENEMQLEALRAMGCDRGQGFHLSRPLPAHEAEALLRSLVPDWSTGFGSGYLSESAPLARH